MKTAKPAVLAAHEVEWTAEYCASTLPHSRRPKRYKHTDIRDSLGTETNERCAYCESRMHAVTWAQIEHILPRSKFPQLVVDWDNLTLACPTCNTNKSDYYESGQPLINPYEDVPSEHLHFVGSILAHRPGDDLGLRSVDILQLCRPELVKERDDRLKAVRLALDQWARHTGDDQKRLAEGIRIDAEAGEFSECVKSMLSGYGFPL